MAEAEKRKRGRPKGSGKGNAQVKQTLRELAKLNDETTGEKITMLDFLLLAAKRGYIVQPTKKEDPATGEVIVGQDVSILSPSARLNAAEAVLPYLHSKRPVDVHVDMTTREQFRNVLDRINERKAIEMVQSEDGIFEPEE